MEKALTKLKQSKKYAGLCPDTLNRVLMESFSRHSKPKEAERAAREKLHGITGAFMTREDLARARKLLLAGDIMAALELHASTRERSPVSTFYDAIFDAINIPTSVLDLACGMNPIYLGARGIAVTGVDIDGELMDMINRWAAETGAPVKALTRDLLCENSLPEGEFDLALVMKLLPIIETQRTGAARALLEAIDARHIIATFPTRTLGGRNVGMESHYAAFMEGVMPENIDIIAKFALNSELIYILAKRS